MVGVAILGAGIFARTATLPAVQASTTLQLQAIWSRSEKSVVVLHQLIRSDPKGAQVDAIKMYWDSPSPSTPGRTLEALLADADVAVVIVALPIMSQPAVVRQALAAGKHVLSEKPVAGDVASARELIAWYDGLVLTGGRPRGLWGVAENFRYQPSIAFAAAELARVGGDVLTFSLKRHGFEVEGDYFNTEWRRVPGHQGGYLLDGGVHFIAALRKLLGAVGGGLPQNELVRVVGFTAQLEKSLPPADTLIGLAQTRGGRSGTVTISYGTEFKAGVEIEVVTTRGVVTWSHELVTAVTTAEWKGGEPGDGGRSRTKQARETRFRYDAGVASEVEAFGLGVLAGRVGRGLSPQEALKDLEVIEGFLVSGQAGATVRELE